MDTLNNYLEAASSFVWGWPLVILLFGTHVYLTIRTGFIQRYLGRAIKIAFGKQDTGEGDISQFGSLATALAATIGTGNIIGVATAITLGGPGAVFWMWLTGVLGIATKYSEALLAVKFRTTDERGQMIGGPMFVLERGMNMKWLGVVFAFLTAVAAFGIGNMVQSNAIATQIELLAPTSSQAADGSFNTIRLGVGCVLALLTALVILGGIKSIARVCEFLVPAMAIFYIVGCLALLGIHFAEIPSALGTIVKSAFSGEAATGGLVGVAIRDVMRYGIARGLFSNEAGLGSAPIVAAAARTPDPVRQALVSASGTFWDTVVVCALTGLVIVSSGHWRAGYVTAEVSGVNGSTVAFEVTDPTALIDGQTFLVTPSRYASNPISVTLSGIEGHVAYAEIARGEVTAQVAPGDVVRGQLPSKQLAAAAFADLPVLGPLLLTVGLLTFVLSTIFGWSYYGEKAVEYLFGIRAITPYRILWVVAVVVGATIPLSAVWNFSDAANGLMAVPNLISLLALSGVVASETRRYLGKKS